ncbi:MULTISPECIES: hypothetical protein [unclassified Rhodococcus (in: high G+C Gram-positive bacteria)]|uniref:hypothetical protein n=1 Tax=unclassified Rhodococcus (in: high G+C Gram-positive bacteria) TaxID=192944 RepID=UPI00163A4411|nr:MULTISPECIES: hypothetical protein [unclassified Rhodococcus (in: high G+C Gram-positive bacteria)]MBC2638226.1 hypothetical protein [Rhodococcus sp. 3A]MBC2897031.1 hypothetical protein [Rhodococcus sp. 4CII]
MSGKGQMALAVGAGYMLGRTKKMKLALMLAAGGASRQLSSGGSLGLLNEGRKLLADSPEVAQLGKTVRHELMNAAKTAAVTAASQRIDSLNSRLQSGESLLGDAAGGRKSTRRRGEEPEDDYEDDNYEDAEVEWEESDQEPDEGEEPDEDTEDKPRARKRPAPRRRSSGSGTSRPGRSRSSADDDDDELARVRRTRAKASTDSTPVRRTRR